VSQLVTVSTHVLDVATGQPAAGLRVTLGSMTATTDPNGRIADLTDGGVNPGTYRMLFDVGAYFSEAPHLFQTVSYELQLDEARHYHVPLLISPYSCTSYRGT
jgi:5-hydroxyisourate hydrolase